MIERILQQLPSEHPWRDRIHWFDCIGSTNDQAKQMALAGAPHGTVLIANRQTAGRGRMGRQFQSPEDLGVYMSVILRPDCQPDELMHLTCAAAVAACDGVAQASGIRPGIKWTNDLVSGGRKLAGILTELVFDKNSLCAIVGIGINCSQQPSDFPEEIRSFAGSLSMISGRETDRCAVAACLVESLCRMDGQLLTKKSQLLARYEADCITLGQDISVLRGDSVRHGHALAIDGDGALIVRFSDGSTETVRSGEVSIRGMYGYI